MRELYIALTILATGSIASAEDLIDVPEVHGKWWQIAPNAPDVGQWSTGQENACDFAIVRSSDSKWHCFSCIRGTSHYGQRLFYRWEADRLTDTAWRPCGQWYYLWQQMSVYRSDDPLDFDDAELIAHMTGIWYNGKWAPEVIEHEGQSYIAGYGRGIRVARLQWHRKTREQVATWRKNWLAYLSEEHRKRLERERQRRKTP